MRILLIICIFLSVTDAVMTQEMQNRYRGSIPETLLRPGRGEPPRYPVDTVIGSMGKGTASDAAFSFANWVAQGLVTGRMNHPSLEAINPVVRESYLSALGVIQPRFYRIGSGREEPDGSTSFLLRFVGRDQAIVAEMYIRHVIVGEEAEEGEASRGSWMLEDLLLDEAMSRDQEEREFLHRVDYVPYERFF